jgi:hypothetical protein
MTTAEQRGRRWLLRNKRIVRALTKIHVDKETFPSQEAAKLADMATNRMGQILKFTRGVTFVCKGTWEFTGEPLGVQV